MEDLFFSVNFTNITPYSPHCFPNLARNSCTLAATEEAKRTGIAVIRLVVSLLSVAGSLSIIISTVARKQVRSPKVFPIFMISIADGLLSLSWISGSLVWLAGPSSIQHRDWCFLPSLLTVMLVCISANLTLVYAFGAYTALRRRSLKSMLSSTNQSSWRPSTTALIYLGAWAIPVGLFTVCFGAMEGVFQMVSRARECSCWCLPYFGNILPLAFHSDKITAQYVHDIRNLVAVYGFVVGTQYLVVFILLVFFYVKILAWIRNIRRQHNSYSIGPSNYGSVNVLLMKGHTQARRRIVYFLSIFLFTGLANTILSYLFGVLEVYALRTEERVSSGQENLPAVAMVLYVLQSLTAPLQGFLNAVVYGWTREEFYSAITQKRINSEISQDREDSQDLLPQTDTPRTTRQERWGEGPRAARHKRLGERKPRTRFNSDSGLFQSTEIKK